MQQNSDNFATMKQRIILVTFLSCLLVTCLAGHSKQSHNDAIELKVANELSAKGGKLPKEIHVGNEVFYVEEYSTGPDDDYLEDPQLLNHSDLRKINVADLASDGQDNFAELLPLAEKMVTKPTEKEKHTLSKDSRAKKVNLSVSTRVNLDTKRRRRSSKNNKSQRIEAKHNLNFTSAPLTFPAKISNENLVPRLDNSIASKSPAKLSVNNLFSFKSDFPSTNLKPVIRNVQKRVEPTRFKPISNLVDDNPLPLLNDLIIDTNKKTTPKTFSLPLHHGIGSENFLSKMSSLPDDKNAGKSSSWFAGTLDWLNILNTNPPKLGNTNQSIGKNSKRNNFSPSLPNVNPQYLNNPKSIYSSNSKSISPSMFSNTNVSDTYDLNSNSTIKPHLATLPLNTGDVMTAGGSIRNQKNSPTHFTNLNEKKTNVSDNLQMKNSFNNNTVIFGPVDKQTSKSNLYSDESTSDRQEKTNKSVYNESKSSLAGNSKLSTIQKETFPKKVSFNFEEPDEEAATNNGYWPRQQYEPPTNRIISPDYHQINPNWSNSDSNVASPYVQPWRPQQTNNRWRSQNEYSRPIIPNYSNWNQPYGLPIQPSKTNQRIISNNSSPPTNSYYPPNVTPMNNSTQSNNVTPVNNSTQSNKVTPSNNPTQSQSATPLNNSTYPNNVPAFSHPTINHNQLANKIKSKNDLEVGNQKSKPEDDHDDQDDEIPENSAVGNKLALSIIVPLFLSIIFVI